MARPLEDVYCTLLMSDSYLPGAAVLAHSLHDAGTKKKLAVLVTLDTLSADTITKLKALYDYVIPVDRIRNPNPANLYLMGRPDLLYAFTKIALWRQTRFRKIVYLDADVVVLRALDELFDIDATFAAAPDVGWPDAFNTGVMVLTPDMGEYWALQTMASTGDSFDGADQGLLNQYFEHRNWHRLRFTYNTTPNAQYQWEPAYRYYKRDISAVHFIGKDKPWKAGRNGPGGYGVYNELLARWWAVHDRHLKQTSVAPTSGSGKEAEHRSSTVAHQNVHGESVVSGDAPTQHSASISQSVVEPEAPGTSTEMPLTEPGEASENIDQGFTEPTPTSQQRQFSAPEMEWDATRFEPPSESKPEAANFPTAQYTFSDSHEFFKAPQVYPEPPKDMWYQVPEDKPKPTEPPKPIFPWERERDRPKPTRVFAEDLPPPEPTPPTPTITLSPSSAFGPPGAHPFSTVHYDEEETMSEEVVAPGHQSPERVSSPKTADQQWQDFQQSNTNAWDSVPGIETYVRAVMESQSQRGKPKVLSPAAEEVSLPIMSRKQRRESLILTDFPSAVERPSLPVTPAPVARPTFWGEERDEQGELPQAEGVPDQQDWVCPQCGFFSVSASDFRRSRELPASPVPVEKAAPPLRLVTTQSIETRPITIQPAKKQRKIPKTQPTSIASEKLLLNTTSSPAPPKPHPRIGNPEEKLEQLRRSSLIEFEHLKSPNHPKAPLRKLPEHSVDLGPPSNHPSKAKTSDPSLVSSSGPAMGGTDAKDVASSSGAPEDSNKGITKDLANPPKPSHGYFALARPENKEDTAAQTPADMPLFVAPNFGTDGTGDELDDAPRLPHEQAPFPRDEPLSPTQTR
ncbi:glycogenin glucosyltransferase [Didymosphaeria variabile]|uniref:glycogenin glucosyltransferase n=1 Tax=Didymosphaeria variabile TaxID=1932322 RepID=A0A9W8XZ00_9PLEO|nr:glycogenin glucosyltransferase [Didymosphaeria variabile]KAJ4361002.1 glycogenin glucosyltransferase [Didymosphaeria variabile]